jgi:hypothetical protein
MGNEVLGRYNASNIAFLHSFFVSAGFFGALACVLAFEKYYLKVVRNEFYGFPEEWFPSVSATVGDLYPARSIFQIFLAFATSVRAALVCLNFLVMKPPGQPGSTRETVIFAFGILRLCAATIFIFITSTDDHDAHDFGMITYLIFTLLYMVGTAGLSTRIANSWEPTESRKKSALLRRWGIAVFVGITPGLIWLFVRHKVQRIPGAYSQYAYLEWCLILIDVGFDLISFIDLSQLELIVATAGSGYVGELNS